nr:zinc finger ccch domain-containing protein 66 [Quercus suber]
MHILLHTSITFVSHLWRFALLPLDKNFDAPLRNTLRFWEHWNITCEYSTCYEFLERDYVKKPFEIGFIIGIEFDKQDSNIIPILLELSSFDDLIGFKISMEEECHDIDEASLWYGRRIGSKMMGFEEKTTLMIATMFGSKGVLNYILETSCVDVNQTCGLDGLLHLILFLLWTLLFQLRVPVGSKGRLPKIAHILPTSCINMGGCYKWLGVLCYAFKCKIYTLCRKHWCQKPPYIGFIMGGEFDKQEGELGQRLEPCLEERLEVETSRVHVNKACSLNGPFLVVFTAWGFAIFVEIIKVFTYASAHNFVMLRKVDYFKGEVEMEASISVSVGLWCDDKVRGSVNLSYYRLLQLK